MKLKDERLIRLPVRDSKEDYLEGFWRWVQLLANNDYQGALESLYWSRETTWTPDKLKERISTFFGGAERWTVVVPNDRLIKVINDASEFQARNEKGSGWLMAQIPLTTKPQDPKRDDIPLMGLATSFFVREHQGHYVMELEIFHL
jgi:hypothetical protein